jgi:hypothetical protein
MILISQCLRLRVDNFLSPLAKTYDVNGDPIKLTEEMIEKMQLIAIIHGQVIKNVGATQLRQKKPYMTRKEITIFGFHLR